MAQPVSAPPLDDNDGRLAKLVGARRAIIHQGRRYLIAPLSLLDVAERKVFLKSYITRSYATRRAELEAVGANAEELAELSRQHARALLDPLGSEFTTDQEPVIDFLFRSLAKAHPDVTLDLVLEMAADPSTRDELLDAQKRVEEAETAVKKE